MKRKEALGLIIVLIVLSGLAVFLYKTARPPERAKSFEPVLPDGVAAALEGPSRITSSQKGEVAWSMKSAGLVFLDQENLALVEGPEAEVFTDAKDTVEVKGLKGEYFGKSEDIYIERDVNIVTSREGRREWVLSGDTASYRHGEEAFYISGFEGLYFQPSGDTVTIKAEKGRYDAKARLMNAKNDVVCNWGGVILETGNLNYKMDENLADTDDDVLISGEGFELKGQGFSADLATRKISVRHKVRLRMEKGMKGIR